MGVSGAEPVRRFNAETQLLLSQLLLDSTLCGSLLHTANMDLKVIVIFALMAVVIHAPVSNGELLFNRYCANVYDIFALRVKLGCMLWHASLHSVRLHSTANFKISKVFTDCNVHLYKKRRVFHCINAFPFKV